MTAGAAETFGRGQGSSGQLFGLQLPFVPGFFPGVGSYPGQHRPDFFFPPLPFAFDPAAFFVAAIAHLRCGAIVRLGDEAPPVPRADASGGLHPLRRCVAR